MSGYDRPEQPAAGIGALENHLGGEAAKRYREYELATITPYIGRSVLEIGSGLGHLSERLLPRVDRLVVSDFDPYCVAALKELFADSTNVEVMEFGLPAEIPITEPVETVVMNNVLEHIVEDVEAVRSVARACQPGGRVVIWVPGYMQLYGEFDRKVGHVTRYTPATLRATVLAAGLEIEVLRPMNFLGGLAWWLAVRVGGARYPNPRVVKIYDRTVVPLTRLIERFVTPPFGQTVFCVARVPD